MRLDPIKPASVNYKELYPEAYAEAIRLGEISGIKNKIITGEQKFTPTTTRPVYGGWIYYLHFYYQSTTQVMNLTDYPDEMLGSFFIKVGITQDLVSRINQIKKDKRRLYSILEYPDLYIYKIALKKAWHFDDSIDIAHLEASLHFLLSPNHLSGEYFDLYFYDEIEPYMDNFGYCLPTDDHRKMLKQIGVQCKC